MVALARAWPRGFVCVGGGGEAGALKAEVLTEWQGGGGSLRGGIQIFF